MSGLFFKRAKNANGEKNLLTCASIIFLSDFPNNFIVFNVSDKFINNFTNRWLPWRMMYDNTYTPKLTSLYNKESC